MTEPLDIISIGHIIREYIIFPDRESEEVLGSPAAYSSVTMARVGARVGVVTRIGPDMPQHLLQPFRDAGVNLEGLNIIEGEPTTATRLVYNEAGDKSIEYPAKANPIRLEDMPEHYQDAKMFNICTMDHDVEPDQIGAFAGLGQEMAIDLGGYGGAHGKLVERSPGIPDELPGIVKHFNLVKASDEDCRRINADPETGDEWIGEQVLEWGADVFVATRGARGALIMTRDGRWKIPPFRGKAIDPTGGGDTFFSGFLVAWQRTRDPEYAGRYGAATALCLIEKSGGVVAERMPTHEMVEACMKRPTVDIDWKY
jgi:ribokinase